MLITTPTIQADPSVGYEPTIQVAVIPPDWTAERCRRRAAFLRAQADRAASFSPTSPAYELMQPMIERSRAQALCYEARAAELERNSHE